MKSVRKDLRNIAIIAHVDHGKTTLVDGLLRQAHTFRENQQVAERVMDSNDLERERGITILAKNTAIRIVDPATGEPVKINIVDTPGHADFGGEVERVLNMVDGVLLLVDAAEGPRPQTRFVLKKALELGHRAIVVINKVDRRGADVTKTLNDTFDLFIELGASDKQADFPVVYAIATDQRAGLTADVGPDLQPLYATILKEIPAPEVDPDAPLQMLVTTLDYDNYRGITAIGRIFAGKMKAEQKVARLTHRGETLPETVQYLYVLEGLSRVEVKEASAGDIVAVAGLENISIGETLADLENPVALPAIHVEEPTVRMMFGVNTSPFAGRESKWSTSRKLRERLYNELRSNLSLRVEDTDSADTFIVSGRGELHLAILIETMRREGYEFHVARPEVILKKDAQGNTLEPFEEVHVEASQAATGAVVEMMGKRRGEMQLMSESASGTTQMTFIVPTRGMLGFRQQFLTATKGTGIMNSLFHGYHPMAGPITSRAHGSLIAYEAGTAVTYGLRAAEERGVLFIGPGTEVYAGMVVGEQPRDLDMEVNVCKAKKLTSVRADSKGEIEARLSPPKIMSLDESIEQLSDDELLEVTPLSLRIRKKILDMHIRGRETKRAKEALKEQG